MSLPLSTAVFGVLHDHPTKLELGKGNADAQSTGNGLKAGFLFRRSGPTYKLKEAALHEVNVLSLIVSSNKKKSS